MITVYIGKPDTLPEYTALDVSILGIPQIMEMIHSVSLFGDTPTYRITGFDMSEDLRSDVLKALPEMAQASSNSFLVFEKLLVADRKKIEDVVTIVERKANPEKKSFDRNDSFALAHAFASGDKKKAWITFQETTGDEEMEKVHGMVWWKLKDMLGKRGVFTPDQMKSLARRLVEVYHESRLGGLSMKDRLEEFFLTLPEVKK